ncbi:YlxR family protein [Mycoplasmopsis gallopavonis]|uniref:Transciprtional termination factor n=1 Tax=Mycoplasmopsis gallopavonis TaxID=76629 RepID=A0A449AZB5_9BACT|nr:YlxR family protein [Mycoplasmopsis gallopavonis]RIV16818.1 YlxR family protein [Mycoplasmopsis gallopavonis]VEU72815.1 Putative transciprtional termination factor [Mycoplasmopsis gallopavonis]
MNEKINTNFTRKCIVTNEIVNVNQLIRFNFDKQNLTVSLDLKRNKKGRGAYMLPTWENWEKAKKNKALNRSFRTNIPKVVYENIEEQLREVLYEQKTK